MNCKNCGNKLDDSWIVCPFCGAKVSRENAEPNSTDMGAVAGEPMLSADDMEFMRAAKAEAEKLRAERDFELVTAPDGKKRVRGYRGNSADVVITGGVHAVEENAFRGNGVITSVVIGDGVTEIGSCAFSGCAALKRVVIGRGVRSIGKEAFADCPSLAEIVYNAEELPSHTDRTNLDAFGFTRSGWAGGGITLTVGAAVHVLPKRLFGGKYASFAPETARDIPNITAVAFEAGGALEKIEEYAFAGCAKLRSVTLPAGLREIGDMAFCDCISLSGIDIPDGVRAVGDCAFSGCTALKRVVMGRGVTHIGKVAFCNCTDLEEVRLYAENCETNLEHAQFPPFKNSGGAGGISLYAGAAVRKIPAWFMQGAKLTRVTFESGSRCTHIDDNAFCGTQLCYIALPAGLQYIGKSAFYGCAGLTGLNVPDSVTVIGDCAFYGLNAALSLPGRFRDANIERSAPGCRISYR